MTATTLWLLLLTATLAGAAVGASDLAAPLASGIVLALAWIKGAAVIDRYMGLGPVGGLWRAVVQGWLALVLGLIALAWWLA